MPAYPNYSMPMNNGYGYNQQIPMQNPYQQRMDFLQSYQQSLQQPVQQIPQANTQMNVIGKIVDGIEAVKAIDIPMDGAMYFFPKADGTEIFGKQWLMNGQTRILTFKPVLDTEPNNSSLTEEKFKFEVSEDFKTAFMERFDSLEKQINDLMTKPMTKSMVSKTKKESVENE